MKNKPLVIGIAGGSGSGKTTLAKNITSHIGDSVAILRHDDYYKANAHLSQEEKSRFNYDKPDAFDTNLLVFHIDNTSNQVAVEQG